MRMGRVVPLCVVPLGVLCLALGTPVRSADDPAPPIAFRIVGYLPDYRARAFDAQAASALTDLIVFSAEPTATGGLDLSRLKNVPWAKLRAFKTRQAVRFILCVGGWERSLHFAAITSSAEKRKDFFRIHRVGD